DGERSFRLTRTGEVEMNPVLMQAVAAELGINFDPTELALMAQMDDGAAFDPQLAYGTLLSRAAAVEGFQVAHRTVLTNFAFQKMAMVEDLKENGDAYVANGLIAAIAGDEEARRCLGAPVAEVAPQSMDDVNPDDEFLVLDADSSQQCAIAN